MARPEGNWMPMYWGDYLRKTQRFTTLHHGAYMLLIAEYWENAKPVPAEPEEQAIIVRLPVKDWLKLRQKVGEKFTERDGLWHHDRVEIELAKAKRIYEARAEAGANGAAKRWQNHSKAMAEPSISQSQNDAHLPSPSPSPVGDTTAYAVVARKPRKARRTRLANDWRVSEEARAYARKVGLVDGEIESLAIEFVRYWTGPDAVGGGLKADWEGVWANRVDDQAARIIGRRSRQPAGRGASPTAARDSILSKAGVRRGQPDGLHADASGGAGGDIAGEASSGTVIDADEWREVPGPADRDEAADPALPRINDRPGRTDGGVPQAADGIPGGRGALRADDASGNQPVVAGMGGIERAAGGDDVSPPADAKSSAIGEMPDVPPFLRRTA